MTDKISQLENAVVLLKSRVFDANEAATEAQGQVRILQDYLSQVVQALGVQPTAEGVVNIEDILEAIRATQANVVATMSEEQLLLEETEKATEE